VVALVTSGTAQLFHEMLRDVTDRRVRQAAAGVGPQCCSVGCCQTIAYLSRLLGQTAAGEILDGCGGSERNRLATGSRFEGVALPAAQGLKSDLSTSDIARRSIGNDTRRFINFQQMVCQCLPFSER
jgi:hypothetical protein